MIIIILVFNPRDLYFLGVLLLLLLLLVLLLLIIIIIFIRVKTYRSTVQALQQQPVTLQSNERSKAYMVVVAVLCDSKKQETHQEMR